MPSVSVVNPRQGGIDSETCLCYHSKVVTIVKRGI